MIRGEMGARGHQKNCQMAVASIIVASLMAVPSCRSSDSKSADVCSHGIGHIKVKTSQQN